MKKIILVLLASALLAGCSKTEYKSGMYKDVSSGDSFEAAVMYCVNEGYIAPKGDRFGAEDYVTLSECEDIISRIMDEGRKNPIEYAVKNGISPLNFGEWDVPATREIAAYMIAAIAEGEIINPMGEAFAVDAEKSFAKDEIYRLYKMGILSGDGETLNFRPEDYIKKAELAVIVERLCNSESRIDFGETRKEVSFVAFGDTIGHLPVIKSGERGGGYNFDHFFENVLPYIENADIACVNQETVFVETGFSGYPAFGGPKEIGEAEAKAGFDVVTHATNHAFDRREGGILYTTEFWDEFDNVEMLGIHEDAEDAEKISVIDKNGIKIAFLNYTYSLNGFTLPKGKEYLVDVLDEEKIKNDMERAKKESDAVVVFAHWGNEYQNEPAESQKRWAQLFADLGAAAVVGHHPHVVQPLEYVEGKDGYMMPVYYSLGNFISNQNDYQTALCAMAEFKIVADPFGVRAEECVIEPVITHMEAGYYSAYLLKDYPDEKLARHKHRGKYGEKFTKEAYMAEFDEIVK